jgi:YHS domain-containing protein
MNNVIDPVCGMTIAPDASLSREHEGELFHFCSALCRGRFDQDAQAYVAVSRLNIEGWGSTPTPGFLQPPLEPLVRPGRHEGGHETAGARG